MTSVTLYEVITTDAEGRAYGMTFHDKWTALAYALAVRRLDYAADVSPAFETEANLTAALQSAATFYADHRIITGRGKA